MNAYGYIYKTVNLLNGKIYIGRRKGQFNRAYHGSGMILKRALKLHGGHCFLTEVLSYAFDKEELEHLEIQHIRAHRQSLPSHMIYNISDGGAGGFTGGSHTEETKRRLSETRSGKNNPMYGVRLVGKLNPMFGKKRSETTRVKIGIANSKHRGSDHGNFGKVRSEEFKRNLSKARKGQWGWWNIGTHLSEETKGKISESAKKRVGILNPFFGRHHSEETKQKIRESKKQRLLACV